MINIMTKHDDNSSLDFLATECEYEVILSSDNSGTVNSALCEGENAGEKCRDVIDEYKLLRDTNHPFPTTQYAFYKICKWCVPAEIGV
jgi:hypothetical protein